MEALRGTAARGAPDVWQQLREFRLSDPLSRLLGYVAALPGSGTVGPEPAAAAAAAAAEAAATATAAEAATAAEGPHVFGLFGSRYFMFALFAGFVISRVHVLVHRRQVRSLGLAARVGLYLPAYLLLARALAVVCVALDTAQGEQVRLWARPAVELVSRAAQQRWGVDAAAVAADGALWQAFAVACVFDCVDVFVARLEGSPCVSYEYIGGLIERMSLYYFYGGSVRIQELAMLAVVEKLMLAHVLMALPSGWRWRLVPTAIANGLVLHHFLFSMASHTGPRSMYPLVQILSMVLVGLSVVIVLTTVSIHWMAHAIDWLSSGHARRRQQQRRQQQPAQAPVALYNRHGVFQGIANADMGDDDDDDDDALLQMPQGALAPIIPDLCRDFGVEILDLAGTCLQQCSSQLQSTGFARPCGAIRLPQTTALDEYIDSAARAAAAEPADCGLAVYIEDEPIAVAQPLSGVARLVGAMEGTRANSVRRLSLGVWAVAAALSHYARDTKPWGPAAAAPGTRACTSAVRPAARTRSPGLLPDGDDESDYDYVCAASDSDSDAASDSGSDAGGSDAGEGLLRETAMLVGDALGAAGAEQSGDRLVATVALMAHSLLDSRQRTGVMTRSMYVRRQAAAGGPVDALPPVRGETDALAQLIAARRQAEGPAAASDDGRMLCVVCWANARCVMLRPCRCLCLCNECRLALVVRNFDHCPCCRCAVAGYSRVFAV
ncbi:hypothetical protein IWQ57_001758 [Coemansia nantahalensis]|uniref:Uncharacterized protein n=1 Tax=Coemansia nantahalensis TaxID=2789366 RepID=A0ACC1K2T1_9FUNG|nr:hypothetical protein IWQ57_001758 [Coemansia nantahalensis]